MKLLKLSILGLFLATTPVLLSACDNNDSLGDKVEEAGEEIGDEIDDATTE